MTVGALATANQVSAFTTIQQLDPIYVDATQSSANLLRLKRNIASGRIKGDGPDQARVKLLLEDGTPYPVEGSLKFSDVTVDPSTGSFILRMVFPNPKNTLLPGHVCARPCSGRGCRAGDPCPAAGGLPRSQGESRRACRGCEGQGGATDDHYRSCHR